MSKLIIEQMSLTTAEDENNYFTGQPQASIQPTPSEILPSGSYRVIDGNLYRVVGTFPPNLPGTNMRMVADAN